MSEFWQGDVEDFHAAFGLVIGTHPSWPDEQAILLRRTVIFEELTETLEALRNKDMEGVADGIADAIYVLLGTAVSLGIDMAPIWKEVHATNMAKAGGFSRVDGKIMKPQGWVAPNIGVLLKEQGWTTPRPS